MDALADAPRMLLRRDGPVATIALNRPEKMNVWNAATEVSAAVASDDFREGVRHFLEKRPPSFTGV